MYLPSTSPSSSSASSLRLLVFSTIEEKHDSDLGLGNTGKKAVVVSISLPIFWCKSLITCKLLGSEMAGLIGFPSASLRCGPMKIKKGKIINYIWGYTSKQFMKDKEITNVILVENHSLNQELWKSTSREFTKTKEIQIGLLQKVKWSKFCISAFLPNPLSTFNWVK